MTPVRRVRPELRVVFDTNALFTEAASDLLNSEVSSLIQQNRHHRDVTITWHLPEIVRHERQYQMSQRAIKFLQPIERLERLLGHNLNITKDILEQRVETVIQSQVTDLGITILEIDHQRVDWRRLVLDAAYRRPPFETGEKEKGFRDALVAESFMQLLQQSSTSRHNEWNVLVTNDDLLAQSVEQRTAGLPNVRIFKTLEELKALINTLASAVDEAFVKELAKKAQRYFFFEGDEDHKSLLYREDIRGKINSQFQDVINTVPEGAEVRENGTFLISPPRFVKKEGQRVYWVTLIFVEAKAYKYVPKESSLFLSTPILQPSSGEPPSVIPPPPPPFGLSLRSFAEGLTRGKEKTLVKNGRAVFEVPWSVSLSTNNRLTAPRIGEIKFKDTIWEGSQ